MIFSWIIMCALVIAFSVGIIFAFMLPAWMLIILQAFFIIALAGCTFCRKQR